MSESNAMPIPARPREGEPPSYEQFCRYIYDTAMGAPAWHVYEDRNYASARQAWLEQRVQELEAALQDGVLIRIIRPEDYEDVCDELVAEDFAIEAVKQGWRYELLSVLSKGAQPKEEA